MPSSTYDLSGYVVKPCIIAKTSGPRRINRKRLNLLHAPGTQNDPEVIEYPMANLVKRGLGEHPNVPFTMRVVSELHGCLGSV